MDKLIKWMLSLLSIAVVALVTTVINNAIAISERPTMEGVKYIVRESSPYRVDQSLIQRELAAMKELREEGATARGEILRRIEETKTEITGLTVKIERLSVTVEQQKQILESRFWGRGKSSEANDPRRDRTREDRGAG